MNLFSILKKVECNLDSSTFYIIAGGSKMSEFKVLKKRKKEIWLTYSVFVGLLQVQLNLLTLYSYHLTTQSKGYKNKTELLKH